MKRVLIAFAVALFIGVLLSDFAVCFSLGCGEPGHRWRPPSIYTFVGVLIAYPLVALLGPGIFWILKRSKRFASWIFLALGFLLGAIGAGVFLWPFEGPAFEYNALRFALFGGFAGLFGGGAFWALGIPKIEP